MEAGSGKSLVYLVAIFQSLLLQQNAAAFLIFPTKALAQDLADRLQCATSGNILEQVLTAAICQDQLRSLNNVAQRLVQRGVAPER